jgi:hypothetical protein
MRTGAGVGDPAVPVSATGSLRSRDVAPVLPALVVMGSRVVMLFVMVVVGVRLKVGTVPALLHAVSVSGHGGAW